MNIFIDVRLCSYGYQGVKTYIEGVLPYFLKTNHIFFLAGFKEFVDNYKHHKNVKIVYFEAPINSIKEQILAAKIKSQVKDLIDVYYFPYSCVPYFFLDRTFVVGLHDVTPYKFWYFYNPAKVILGYFITRIISKKAKKIIAVSKTTAEDIIRYFSVEDSKVSVIYDGVSDEFVLLNKDVIDEFKRSKGLNEYLLYVGNREHTKNIFRLLEAVKILRKKGYNLDFVIVGRKFKKYENMDRRILSYGKWVRIFYDVSKEDLVKFYNAAKLYVHAALNEGFGLPVVEAMKCGCICVVSDISVFREILGDDGIYFNPYSVSHIVATIEKVLTSYKEVEKLKIKYVKLANNFTWEISAKNLLKVLEEVKEKK